MESRTRVFEIIIWIAVLLLMVTLASHAGDIQVQDARFEMQISKTEKLAMLAAFAAVDYGQSVEMFYRRDGYYELNPLLGKHPTRRDMLVFGVAGIGLTWVLSEILPEPLESILVDSIIASERMNVEENYRVLNGRRRRINGVPIVVTFRF